MFEKGSVNKFDRKNNFLVKKSCSVMAYQHRNKCNKSNANHLLVVAFLLMTGINVFLDAGIECRG